MTPTHIIALTISCIDYLSLHSVWVFDRATGEAIDTTVLSPAAAARRCPPHSAPAPRGRARPAHGTLTLDGVRFKVPPSSWAVLDHGRGRWPYQVWWNWAAGSGTVDGRVIGLQLGSKWTDGSGATENALVVDGHLSKISEELVWDYDASHWMAPWRIHGERADLTFTPFYNKHSQTNVLVISTRTDQLFGTWTGWIRDEAGIRVKVDGIEGWAEDVLNRW